MIKYLQKQVADLEKRVKDWEATSKERHEKVVRKLKTPPS